MRSQTRPHEDSLLEYCDPKLTAGHTCSTTVTGSTGVDDELSSLHLRQNWMREVLYWP